MSDPVLDEDFILRLLSAPADGSTEFIEATQAGAVQALADVYDRSVVRDQFTGAAAACVGLYAQCAKLWLLNNINQVYINGVLDQNAFDKAREGITALVQKQAQEVASLVQQLRQCPTSKDKVH